MEQVYKVSQINAYIRNRLEDDPRLKRLCVEGEVSNCRYHSSGHVYFSLKEREAQLSCVMFASARSRGLPFRMTDGMLVQVTGSIGVYERDGKYQLYATSVAHAGVGALYEEFERRKRDLAARGIFDRESKRALPRYPKRVGIVTAEGGAALQDILQILHRRNPYIQPVLAPCQVQGAGAEATIIRALHWIENAGVDVIIVGRGGGSIEDLWEFNGEALAVAVHECRIPVVSAVGHEINTTLIDFAADVVAPTPSAAAELVSSVTVEEFDASLVDAHFTILQSMLRAIEASRRELAALQARLRFASPQAQMVRQKDRLAELSERMHRAAVRSLQETMLTADSLEERLRQQMRLAAERARAAVELLAAKLTALSPRRVLQQGYAYVTVGGKPLGSVTELAPGTVIRGALADGLFEAAITSTAREDDTHE